MNSESDALGWQQLEEGVAIANEETQLQEAERRLSSSGLLCCVLVQRPRSVVSCYYQCCVCGYLVKSLTHLMQRTRITSY